MLENRLYTRIIQKHDTEERWLLTTDFIPNAGEVIIYDVDTNYNYVRMKVGDGIHNVNDLPFVDVAAIQEAKMYTDTAISTSVANWNENDEMSASYVKNRTHWVETNQVVIANQQTVKCVTDRYLPAEGNIIHNAPLIDQREYLIVLNGTEYKGVAVYNGEAGLISVHADYVGENDIFESISYYPDTDLLIVFTNAEGSFQVEIYEINDTVHQLDSKYISTATDDDIINMLISIDAMSVLADEDGAIYTDDAENILLI